MMGRGRVAKSGVIPCMLSQLCVLMTFACEQICCIVSWFLACFFIKRALFVIYVLFKRENKRLWMGVGCAKWEISQWTLTQKLIFMG